MTREEAIEGFRHSISMSKLDLKVNKKNMSIEREIMVLNSIARNEMAIEALKQKPKTGHWIKTAYGDCRCSICNEIFPQLPICYFEPKYCCNCGADMRGDADADSD